MRVLFFYILFLAQFVLNTSALASNSNEEGAKKVGIVVVIDGGAGYLNLEPSFHELAINLDFATVMYLDEYQRNYYPNTSKLEVFANIRQTFKGNVLYYISKTESHCFYDTYQQTANQLPQKELKLYLSKNNCFERDTKIEYSVNDLIQNRSAIDSANAMAPPTIYFGSDSRDDLKANIIVTASLIRSGTPEELTEASEIVVYSYPITAEENIDYIPFSKVVRFEAGETRVLFDYQLLESDGVSDEFGIGLRYPVNAQIPDDPSKSSTLIVKLYSDSVRDNFTIKTPNLPFYNEGEDYKITVSRDNINQQQVVEYTYELVGIGPEFISSQTNFVFANGTASIDLTFKVNDDFKFNPDPRFVNFNFKETGKVIFPNGASVSLPIGDNRRSDRGIFGFEYPKYVAKNNTSIPEVKVVRKNSTTSVGKFNLTITDQSSPYSTNQTIDFKEGQSSVVLDVSDLPKENADISFKLTPLLDAELFQAQAVMKVVDPTSSSAEIDQLVFKPTANSVVEGNSSFTIPLERKGLLDYESSVNFVVSGGTAIEGVDFKLKQSQIVFANTETTKNLEIEILNDDVYSGDRVISLAVSSASLKLQSNFILIDLIENDLDKLGTISFASTDVKVAEEQLNLPITFKRDIAGAAVEFNLNAIDGKAKAGVDFEWNGTRKIRFEDGQTEVTTYINMIGDTVPDFDKDFSLKITSDKQLSFGSSQMNITIDDNEKANAIFVKPTGELITVEQGQISFMSTMSEDKFLKLTLTRTVNTSEAFKLVVRTQDGTAKAGTHFKDFNETLLFAAGETTKTITLTLYKTEVLGSSNDFTLMLTADTKNYIPDNPALQIKMTPNVPPVAPGGESSGGSFSYYFVMFMAIVGLYRRQYVKA
jgi:hypothetical protein